MMEIKTAQRQKGFLLWPQVYLNSISSLIIISLVQTAYLSAMWSTDHYNDVEDYDEDEENRQ